MFQRGLSRADPRGRRGISLLLWCVGLLLLTSDASAQVPLGCPGALGTEDLIDHNLSISFCELCDEGDVRIVIENPLATSTNVDFSEIVITEDLRRLARWIWWG